MRESAQDIQELQELLDSSYDRAGEHLKGITTPDRRLTAQHVIRLFGEAQKQMAVATVTADGRPLVAPVDAILLRGSIYLLMTTDSVRGRHLKKRPQLSVSLFQGDEYAVNVHGRAEILEPGHQDWQVVDDEVRRIYGSAVRDWSPGGMYVRVEPDFMHAFAHQPERF
jgi:hypothetical protein